MKPSSTSHLYAHCPLDCVPYRGLTGNRCQVPVSDLTGHVRVTQQASSLNVLSCCSKRMRLVNAYALSKKTFLCVGDLLAMAWPDAETTLCWGFVVDARPAGGHRDRLPHPCQCVWMTMYGRRVFNGRTCMCGHPSAKQGVGSRSIPPSPVLISILLRSLLSHRQMAFHGLI